MKESQPASITVCKYGFCHIFIFISTWAFSNGFISRKMKSCNSLECCSFGHMFIGFLKVVLLV